MIDCLQRTKEYYAAWLDIAVDVVDRTGVVLAETEKRKICPRGYPRNFELFSVATAEALLVSFSHDLDREAHVHDNFDAITDVTAGIDLLKNLFEERLCWRRTYYFVESPGDIDTGGVVCLTQEAYPDYLSFFLKQNPDASPEGWLEDYFVGLVDDRRCYGIYRDHALVCATGAPDMPFMSGAVTELGVDTLAEFRGKGYARAVCTRYIDDALSRDEAPLWTCWHGNKASVQLAEQLGFTWFADLYTIEGPCRRSPEEAHQ
jgi:GNAT superfamily N-acetyltransferase